MTEQPRSSTLEDLTSVVVSRPVGSESMGSDGAWAAWCAQRRRELGDSVDWDDPEVVLDLTTPEPTVSRLPVSVATPAPEPLAEPTATLSAIPGRLVTIAAVAIVVLNCFDIVTTQLALATGASEGNPIAALFVDHLPIFVAIKILLPGSVALRMWLIRDRTTPMLLAAMWWVVGVYSMVIVINALHLL